MEFTFFLLFLCISSSIKSCTGKRTCLVVTEDEETAIVTILKETFIKSTDVYPEFVSFSVGRKQPIKTYVMDLQRVNFSDTNVSQFYKGGGGCFVEYFQDTIVSYSDGNDFKHLIQLEKESGTMYTITGTICIGRLRMNFEPMKNEANRKSSTTGVLHRILTSTCRDKGEIWDNKMLEQDVTVGQNIASENHLDKKHLANEKRISVNRFINTEQSNGHSQFYRKKRYVERTKRTATQYTVDLLMVVDHAAYKWWNTLVGPSIESEVMGFIRQYYGYVIKGINEKFRTMNKQPFEIVMAFSGLLVAKTEEESLWTSSSMLEEGVDGRRAMVNSSEALEKFQLWLDDENDIPLFDHAILFTGTNLTYAGNAGNTGLAFASSLCRNISNSSIVEDMFDHRTIMYASQQIARSLGARDDMDNNDCLEFFNYIMSNKIKLPMRSFPTNRWRFSSCSEQYIKEYIGNLNHDGINCIKGSSLEQRYPTDLVRLFQDLPGKHYGAGTQCRHRFGIRSDICRVRIGNNYGKICTGLLCSVPDQDVCEYILPADGTPCGNMKYCLNGKCSKFEDAEERMDSCVFGDSPNANCNGRIGSEPFLCYKEDINYECCSSCKAMEIDLPGCEYGDRINSCTFESCIHEDKTYTSSTCCLTCSDIPTPYAPPPANMFTLLVSTQSSLQTAVLDTTTFSSLYKSTLARDRPSNDVHATGTIDFQGTITSEIASNKIMSETTLPVKNMIYETTTIGNQHHANNDIYDTPSKDIHSSNVPITEENSIFDYVDISTDNELPKTTKYFSQTLIPTTENIITQTTETANQQSDSPMATLTKSSNINTQTPYITTYKDPTSNVEGTTIADVTRRPVLPPYSQASQAISRTSLTDTSPSPTVTETSQRPPFPSRTTQTAQSIPSPRTTTETSQPLPSTATADVTTATNQCICSTDGRKTGSQFAVNDRIFIKSLAISMRQNQRKIRQVAQNTMKHLYTAVMGKLRSYQEADYEYVPTERASSDIPSNDEENITMALAPVWRTHYKALMRGMTYSIKQMRYRVLMLANQHLDN